ncbi:MAG: WYL domain-containing protein, partial [Deltaproteobacteria bacterium]
APRNGEGIKEYEINPLGLVLKDGVLYLVCSMWDYPDIRLLVLHRMRVCEVLDVPASAPEGFDLDEYIASGELNFALDGEIELRALFSPEAAFHLAERPLSDDQRLEEQEDGRVQLTATVVDSSELRWWLLGFGDQVEVCAPAELREDMWQTIKGMYAQYAARE